MHIVHIIPYYAPAWAYGGPVRVAYELTRRLADRGHTITVLTTDANDASSRLPTGIFQHESVQVIRYRNLSNRLAWKRIFLPQGFRLGLSSIIDTVDLVHIHEFRTVQNTLALPLLRKRNVPYVLTSHGSLPSELGRSTYKQLYDWLTGNNLFSHAAHLHAITMMEREQYLARGASPERIVTIPNGIEVSDFAIDVDLTKFKQQYSIQDDNLVIGFLGRLNHIKAPDILLEAFVNILKQHPAAILLLAGPDDGAQTALETQIKHAGIEHAVRFTGYLNNIEDKTAAYRVSNIYVLPSRYEILGITALEALLNNTPTILTDNCGLAQQLKQEDVVTIVPVGNASALTSQLLTLLNNPDDAQKQAVKGQAVVAENFNWDTLIDRWLELYERCVQVSI